MKDYLLDKGHPVKSEELTEYVKKRRHDLKSKDLHATVRHILQRSSLFRRTSPGTYDVKSDS